MEKIELIKELVKEQLKTQPKSVINAGIEGMDWAFTHKDNKSRDVRGEIDRRYPIPSGVKGRTYEQALMCSGFEWGVDAFFKYW